MRGIQRWLLWLVLGVLVAWFILRIARFVFWWMLEPLVVGFIAGFIVAALIFTDASRP
jgi:hypothetical protein